MSAGAVLSATGGSAATQAVDLDERRWATRKGTAFAIRAAAVVLPFLASLLVARMLQQQLPHAHAIPAHVLRWTVVIIGSTSVLVTADRVTRNLLPIAALFRVAMVFPDRAPSRYKVALRTGSAGVLAKKVRDGADLGDTPAEAAENVLVLLNDVRNHDRLTRGHSERVRAYAEIIAEEMELPAADREKLRWAALIHDVGKLSVPSEILIKTGRPTEAEWHVLRGHPAAGGRILAPLEPWLGDWLGAATEHHERVDGKGYPRGLVGDEISLAGRIVGVADAYDCMTSTRSYKKALPPAQARFELSRNAGTQFDAEVVRAFLSVSVGRLHLAGGPLAWLSSLPGVRDVATGLSGAAASASGAVAATGVAVVAAATGQVAFPSAEPAAARPPMTVEVGAPVDPGPSGGAASAPDRTGSGADADDRDPTDAEDEERAERAEGADEETPDRSRTTTTTSTTSPGRPGPTTTAPPATSPPVTAPPATGPTPTSSLPGRTPAAVNDNRSVPSGSRTDIDVLANDSDPDGDLQASSLRIVSGPSIGSASVSGGYIRFQAPTVTGSAQQTFITYQVCDSGNRCATATLKIVVTPST